MSDSIPMTQKQLGKLYDQHSKKESPKTIVNIGFTFIGYQQIVDYFDQRF
jgi:hypothetical protein